MNTINFTTATPQEVLAFSISKFEGYRKEFQDYLNAPMLVGCNSVIVVNHDNSMTIGVDVQTNTTKLVHGFEFPCTFTPEAAKRICKEASCFDGEGKKVSMEVKNIAVFLREQIKMCDTTLETLKKSPFYNA